MDGHSPGRFMIRNEPAITPELVAEHGLKPDEYERILKLIGRAPTFTELGIFSAIDFSKLILLVL